MNIEFQIRCEELSMMKILLTRVKEKQNPIAKNGEKPEFNHPKLLLQEGFIEYQFFRWFNS